MKTKYIKFIVIFFYLLSFFMLFFSLGLNFVFDDVSFEQIVFHLKYAKDIINIELEYIAFFIFFICLGTVFLYQITKSINPKIVLYGSVFLFFIVCLGFSIKYDFASYIRGRFDYSDFYEKNYVQPKLEDFSAKSSSKNVIILFLESMETKYADKNIWGDNLLKEQSHIQNTMGKYYSIKGSNWTVASMTTVLCGVPLNVEIDRNQYGGKKYDFLPNLICLPDIFNQIGYKNYFIYGSFAHFGGTDTLFKSHNVDAANIYDFRDMMMFSQKKFDNKWGYPDSIMYRFLRKKILELKNKKEKFFIVSATINTHHPYIYSDDNCSSKYQDWRDVVSCADKQVSDFVQWFYKEGLDKNTILLIIGDHLTMDKKIAQAMSSFSRERTLVNILIAGRENIKQRKFSGLDIMPTVIEAADISSKSSRLGLGVSLFDGSQQTLIEKYGLDKLNEELQQNSLVYESFL